MSTGTRVLVVNPFHWGPRHLPDPLDCAFTAGLRKSLCTCANAVEIEYIRSACPESVRLAVTRKNVREPALIYACGTTAMQAAVTGRNRECPILYWGGHPREGNSGACHPRLPKEKFVAGLRHQIPLYEDYRQFRVLRDLFPSLNTVYAVFAATGNFCRNEEEMGCPEAYSKGWRHPSKGRFPALAKVAAIIDVELFEHVYGSVASLQEELLSVPPRTGCGVESVKHVVITCSDCYHIPGAAEMIATLCHERRIPYVTLSRLDFHGETGPLLSFENDWVDSAAKLGIVAGQFLRNQTPFPVGIHSNDSFQARYYFRHAARLGLTFPSRAVARLRRAIGPLVYDPQASSFHAYQLNER